MVQINKLTIKTFQRKIRCCFTNQVVPEFYNKVYLPNKDKGFSVFAIYSMDDKAEWTEFLSRHDMFEWINVWDEHHASRFKIKYDARKTPGIYLLDESKTIIAKKMTIEQLEKIIPLELN